MSNFVPSYSLILVISCRIIRPLVTPTPNSVAMNRGTVLCDVTRKKKRGEKGGRREGEGRDGRVGYGEGNEGRTLKGSKDEIHPRYDDNNHRISRM